VVILFDGSFEGFLCVVYVVYYEKIEPVSIQVQGFEQLALDTVPYYIETDLQKSTRVFNAIYEKISEEAAEYVYNAFHSAEDGRFMSLLKYLRLGFSVGHMVDSHLHEDFVRDVQKMSKYVCREAHLLHGFCRFVETAQNVYYCDVTPKNDVLIMLATHFEKRMMNQAWIIHDKTRNKAAIYDGNSYVITAVPASDAAVPLAEGEAETQELWVTFFNTIAIDERRNPKLQRQLVPLYFRKNMTEFKK
jgi:probable DNA metabolism protein